MFVYRSAKVKVGRRCLPRVFSRFSERRATARGGIINANLKLSVIGSFIRLVSKGVCMRDRRKGKAGFAIRVPLRVTSRRSMCGGGRSRRSIVSSGDVKGQVLLTRSVRVTGGTKVGNRVTGPLSKRGVVAILGRYLTSGDSIGVRRSLWGNVLREGGE